MTDAERGQGGVMPDPTPVRHALADPLGFAEWLTKQPLQDACAALNALMDHRIRAAVAAERERAAIVDQNSVKCPYCSAEPSEPCKGLLSGLPLSDGTHASRWRAAIRRGPDAD